MKFFVICCVLLTATVISAEERYTFLICHEGGPGSKEEAEPYLDTFFRYLESKSGWKKESLNGCYIQDRKEGITFLKEKKPAFAAISLGIYLETRKNCHIFPLVLAKKKGSTTDVMRILVRKGSFSNLSDLKDKTLTGDTLFDPVFMSSVIFKHKIDVVSYFKLIPTRRPLRGLRKVTDGELDAAMVTSIEYESLQSLPKFKDMVSIFESDPIPILGLTYIKGQVSEKDVECLKSVLIGMSQDPQGVKICETFGIDGFMPAPLSLFDPIEELYQKKD